MSNNMDYDAFLRAISLNPQKKVSFFLGAGASIESGVLSASDCILQWKKQIYDSNNSSSPFRQANFKADSCIKEVQRWIDAQRIYPILGDESEYSFFAEKAYPDEADRGAYFSSIFSGVSTVSAGYKLLAYFARQGFVERIWTTNFDDLILKANTEQNISQIDVALDCKDRVLSRINSNSAMVIKLHGDYKYTRMKNTATELDIQEAIFVQALADLIKDTDLIITGYSGRDNSIMIALLSAFANAGNGRLFWLGIDKNPNVKVANLIDEIAKLKRTAYYVVTSGFDSVMLDIAEIKYGQDANKKREIAEITAKTPIKNVRGFTAVAGTAGSALSTNSFLVQCPKYYYQFTLTETEQNAWTELRESINLTSNIVADRHQDCIIFLGDKAEMQSLFSRNLQFTAVPFDNANTRLYKTFRLMRSALAKVLVTQQTNLRTDGKRYIWDATKKKMRVFDGKTYLSYDGIEIELEFCSRYPSHNLLTILPKCHVECDAEEWDKNVIKSISDEFFTRINKGYKSNSGMHGYLMDWHTTLTLGAKTYKFVFANNPEMEFIVGKKTALIGVVSSEQQYDVPSERVIYTAVEYKDPKLSFYDRTRGQLSEDFHPMRGLINNAPYETMFAPAGIAEDVKIAIVLPQGEKQKMAGFFAQLNTRQTVSYNANYVLPYGGFYDTYKIPLTIPPTNNALWQEFHVPNGKTEEESSRQLAESIITAIKAIHVVNPNCVIAIYIPKYLDYFDGFNNDTERFDLHDYVKAFAIPKGIPTQFIREKTLDYTTQDIASVAWTLSLALYVKSGRTPWIINKLTAENTAFVGIGYSVDVRNKNNPIVLGCSHIFSADGQSVRYRLSKVKNPQFDSYDSRRKNPYLTEDEAYRLGCRVNDMIRKSFAVYPKRVVFHKTTPFKQGEVDGLIKSFALNGITDVDLLTITYEDDLRAFQLKKDLTPGDFPLRRGVGFVADEHTMFLYTHGLANPIDARGYVMGGKSLPIPLKITKHYGNSTAERVANDILGLTRMNWNNFNLYSKLPCTIESSNIIARIGYLLSAYDGAEYDYRLFI